MKAVISLKQDDGTYREVGMTGRTIVTASSIIGVHQKARQYAQGQPYRVEIFFNTTDINGEPNQIQYRN